MAQVTSYKTKMFSSRLPSGYTELEYIQSTGTQYIQLNSGFLDTDEVEIKIKLGSTGSDKYLVVPTTWNTNSNRFAMGGTFNQNDRTIGFGGAITAQTKYTPSVTPEIGQITTEKYAGRLFTITGNGITSSVNVTTISFGGETNNLKLFYGYNSLTAGTIYYWKHKKVVNGTLTLVENLVPAKRTSDNAIGMFDLVTNQFFTNSGTGTFTGGPEVTTVVDCYKSVMFNYRLPAGYTELEYIQSTGTQYIDTRITPSNNMELNATIMSTSSAIGTFMGSGTNDNDLVVFWSSRNATTFRYIAGCYPDKSKDVTISDFVNRKLDYKQVILPSSQSAYVDGTLVGSSEYSANGNNVGMFLFGRKFNGIFGSAWSGRIYEISLKKDNVEVLHYIPAKNASNVLGMYDLVTNQFFTNAGSGSFIAGSELPSLIPVTSYKSVMFN